MKGHSHFAAINSRSGREYRIDSMSFPTGHFTLADLPDPIRNWSFTIHDDNCRHDFNRSAAVAYADARMVKPEVVHPPREFAAVTKSGAYLANGDIVTDARGEEAIFLYVSRASIPGKSAKVIVDIGGYEYEHYERIWGIEVVEGTGPFFARIGRPVYRGMMSK